MIKQVYCTNCINFGIKKIGEDDFKPVCKHETECSLTDCEDSKSIIERPLYKES